MEKFKHRQSKQDNTINPHVPHHPPSVISSITTICIFSIPQTTPYSHLLIFNRLFQCKICIHWNEPILTVQF